MIIQEEMGTAARRYSRRDRQLGAIPLPESMFLFIHFKRVGEWRRLLSGSQVFSDEGYPFHAVRYNLRVVGPL